MTHEIHERSKDNTCTTRTSPTTGITDTELNQAYRTLTPENHYDRDNRYLLPNRPTRVDRLHHLQTRAPAHCLYPDYRASGPIGQAIGPLP